MTDFIESREKMIEALRQELVGPSPQGEPIDCTKALSFPDWEKADGPYFQQESAEEILTRDRPTRRYGIGVLYPAQTPAASEGATTASEAEELSEISEEESSDSKRVEVKRIGSASSRGDNEDDAEIPLSSANDYRPSSIGVSFVAELNVASPLIVEVTGGFYTAKAVTVIDKKGEKRETQWWLRSPLSLSARFDGGKLLASRGMVNAESIDGQLPDRWALDIRVMSRPRGDGKSLLTAICVNRNTGAHGADAESLFQVELAARVEGQELIHPYDEVDEAREEDELKSLSLLYRNSPSFAVGHGCAADWAPGSATNQCPEVRGVALPVVETPSITPVVIDRDSGETIEVPMDPLTRLHEHEGFDSLEALADAYTRWIDGVESDELTGLEPDHHRTAEAHLSECRIARDRIRDGIEFLRENAVARRAFELANEAMLEQQDRSSHKQRETVFDRSELRFRVEGEAPKSPGHPWRPFQIAFVLASLRSTALRDDEDRKTVELIFFPTGGGKTEAYLALTAFSIFHRRLTDPDDLGVDVLMRYTLRLLTAQQFQRAAALICAMERIRRRDVEALGESSFSVGVWLGGDATPNRRSHAKKALKELNRRDRNHVSNPFVLLKCPWCAAQMGPISVVGKQPRGRRVPVQQVAGYKAEGDSVMFACPDPTCPFHDRLPVYVIDDDVYEHRPSLVIGTVDKFAMLAFRPDARSMFGIGDDGSRVASPPNLIIQDELHLISGPLGSMVGLYEALIEELCTDRRAEKPSAPKIIGSTATIRRYAKQIDDLYARERSALFPPRGIDASDSFFASYALDENGDRARGRVYVGIHGAGLGSIQTAQVRTFASLLQNAALLEPEERDPWWTLLAFFNSLRELGTSLSLLQSDIRDYLRVIQKRFGLDPKDVRHAWNVLELTGRMANDEVPKAIELLENTWSEEDKHAAVDVCLASNIVEVGVDVSRLSLMAVIGQPKTTAQYIQATGRVGRRWETRPGLITTIYGPSKPRDRSHFEKFRAYHERLYAQVEPTSVTPFAPPVMERALHAVAVAYVRQLGDINLAPTPVPEDLLAAARELLQARVDHVDRDESERFRAEFSKRLRQWERWQRVDWARSEDGGIPLLRFAGAYADAATAAVTWGTPTSMRNVDAECRAQITDLYMLEDEEKA